MKPLSILFLIITGLTHNIYATTDVLTCESQLRRYFFKKFSEEGNFEISEINILEKDNLTFLLNDSVESTANKDTYSKIQSDAKDFFSGQSDKFLFYEVVSDGLSTYIFQIDRHTCSIVRTATIEF